MSKKLIGDNRDPIDLLGEINAEIAKLEIVKSRLRDKIAKKGAGSYEGELFRATVSVYDKKTLDMKAVKRKLSPQFIRANTKTKKGVVRVEVTSRTGEGI
jgi:hypothetical protein